jgi:ribosomal protein S3
VVPRGPHSEAHTTYGVIGVKVWIFKGEVFDTVELEAQPSAEGGEAPAAAPATPPAAAAPEQAPAQA